MLALLVCGLLLRRRLVLSLRQRKRDQASPNQAALALYGSLVELHRIAQSRLPGWEEPLPPQLVQLSLKARFSQHTLTPEELDAFQKEQSYLAAQLQTRLPTSPAAVVPVRPGVVLTSQTAKKARKRLPACLFLS